MGRACVAMVLGSENPQSEIRNPKSNPAYRWGMIDRTDSAEPAGVVRRTPLRLLVVCPSWLGDVAMATPALRLLRARLPGSFIGGLVRPGLDELLAGSDFFDELHVDRARGMMGPKHVAAKIRPRRYDAAVLLTNSFSTALITRLAFIPRRIGYDRDGRGLLLTERLKPERSAARGGDYACISAVEYYLRAARAVVGEHDSVKAPRLELGVTAEQQAAGRAVLEKAGVRDGEPYAVLNPGANNPAKRWPAERFAAAGMRLIKSHGFKVLVNGSPAEADLCDAVVRGTESHVQSHSVPPDVAALGDSRCEHSVSPRVPGTGCPPSRTSGGTGTRWTASLPACGITIGALKHIVHGARVMLTNDTGPRHIAAAFGVPVVTLFGPTDPRWTTLPEGSSPHAEVAAGPEGGLPAGEIADDHPEACRIDKIEIGEVVGAVDAVLGGRIAP